MSHRNSESNRRDIVTIPRTDLKQHDVNLPFKLRCCQFPVIAAFAMTIKKSQRQTFEHVGIFLSELIMYFHMISFMLYCRVHGRVKISKYFLIKRTANVPYQWWSNFRTKRYLQSSISIINPMTWLKVVLNKLATFKKKI